jgi:hypothetical protein
LQPLPKEWSEEEKARRAEKVKMFIDRYDEDSKKVCKDLHVSADPDAKDDPLYDIFEIQFDIVEKMEVATRCVYILLNFPPALHTAKSYAC